MRRFAGLRLSEPMPDETTILNFRHLLEQHELGQGLFQEINRHLAAQGLRLREGTIVDASIIEAPSSTKNRTGRRDPEMRQTKKGNQWHFGMKVHLGVDSETGVAPSFTTTAANAHDVTEAHNLLHGGETVVWGDAGYRGVHKREENLGWEVDWQMAMRPGLRRKLDPGRGEALVERNKASKASMRSKVEHPFLKVKRVFGYAKSLPSSPIGGALPGSGEEHPGAGGAFGTGQPADGGGPPGRVTEEQWARILPRTAVGADHGPNGNRIRGRTLQKTSRRPDIPAKLTR